VKLLIAEVVFSPEIHHWLFARGILCHEGLSLMMPEVIHCTSLPLIQTLAMLKPVFSPWDIWLHTKLLIRLEYIMDLWKQWFVITLCWKICLPDRCQNCWTLTKTITRISCVM